MAFPTSGYACTMFFSDNQNSTGWTETYFRDSVSIAAALTAAQALRDLRIAFLCNTYTQVALRVSGVPTPLGDSLLDSSFNVGALDSTTNIPCEPWTALMARMEAGSTKRGRKFFHGVPRNMFTGARNYDAGNPNNAVWLTFAAALLLPAWGIRVNAAVFPVVSYEYRSLTSVYPQRQVEHKVGRPFGLLRGRR